MPSHVVEADLRSGVPQLREISRRMTAEQAVSRPLFLAVLTRRIEHPRKCLRGERSTRTKQIAARPLICHSATDNDEVPQVGETTRRLSHLPGIRLNFREIGQRPPSHAPMRIASRELFAFRYLA